ncbi:MAG: response regulator transcription factor [Gammaproteobacteria bacterium]|nr:response regulator transcription factor [Gammaproteobacteria bacterium]MBT8094825.1 response regulator transcription factor [Gammaproteobacteria bacterium]MBT8104999.1 response regulator transcription factor [Gammaproteobacteria bacterium]NNF49201.1 response regulator transcription factor [Woeseiaceae bacterium]NNK25013.1 response regulator transcription factor [Woeseiaceae bacterium]
MTKVLIIDDDRKHSDLLQAYFKRFGIKLICAYDATEGFKKLSREDPDLLLLDIMLPGKDGFEICREVRKTSNIPIIMLTARGDIIDRVSGLELGADDYVGKPFEPRELVARVQATLRRSESTGGSVDELNFEGLSINTDSRSVRVDDKPVDLTSMEYELLLLLARRPGKKLSRDDILSELRGIDAAILTRSVDIMISRLRQKLGDAVKPPRFIQTVWGRGYSFIGQPPADA